MNILSIGQLPKEVGGNYTTGAANVLYELSKQKAEGIKAFAFATNAKNEFLQKICTYENQYMGYEIELLPFILDFLKNPIRFYREAIHYRNDCNLNPLRGFFYKYNFVNAIKKCKPDVIHCHDFDKMLSLKNALSYNIPIIMTCHGIFWNDKEKVHRAIIYNVKLADFVTGLTAETYEAIIKLGVPKDRITIIPNGVDSKKFYYSEIERNSTRRELGVIDNQIVFLTVASVQKRKGQLEFLKILNRLNINFVYCIIGKGQDEEHISLYAKENGIEEKVKLLGYHSANELYRFYSAADIYVHASLEEGQSLSEIEAYTTGLRTIVNEKVKATIVTDLSQDNYFTMDFSSYKPEELTSWIIQLPNHRQSRGGWDWSIIESKYSLLYKSISLQQK